MNYSVRLLPSRELIRKTSSAHAAAPFDPAAAELVLTVLNTASLVHAEIISELERRHGLSEGKFLLLMALLSLPEGCGIRELAERVGVSVPTVSVMVKRMKADSPPLIETAPDPEDARGRRVRISPAGIELIEKVIPGHFSRVSAFASRLSASERETLLALLQKLLAGPAGTDAGSPSEES